MGRDMLTVYVALSYTTTIEHEYYHEQHTVHLIIYHIIWCPKRRRKIVVGPVHDRLKQIIEHSIERQRKI